MKKEPLSISYSESLYIPEEHRKGAKEHLHRRALHELGYEWAKNYAKEKIEYVYKDRFDKYVVYDYKIRKEDPMHIHLTLIEIRTILTLDNK